ncbi:MAG: sensor histidine kinase, partial [Gemmatimonadaceae bacterium]
MGAVETAARVEGLLAVHGEALKSVRELYADTTRPLTGERFRAFMMGMARHAFSFRGVWLTDSSGIIRHEIVFGAPAPPLPAGIDIDTVQALGLGRAARRGYETQSTQISASGPTFAGEPGFIILEPLYAGDRFLGFAGGSITSGTILRNLRPYRSGAETGILLLAGMDTVVAVEATEPASTRSNVYRAPVRVPGGGTWDVAVTYRGPDRNTRLLLWGTGLATLSALVVTLLHERRQGVRLAERSAELERLSTELLRANRAKSEFLANVSHELRTPLNAIVGFTDLLRDGVYGDLSPRQVGPVDRIASSANHLRQLVDQVLDIAKLAAGRLEVHAEPIDLRPFVLDVVSEVEMLVSERGLNLSIAISSALPRVRTDPMHLRQILVNLLGNAVKYTPSGGVAVRARLVTDERERPERSRTAVDGLSVSSSGNHADWVVLQVADSGIGIAAADRERIFGEFEQVGAGPRGDSVQRGTGLGLAISRRLARLLGGDLTVESELGRGSTFSVWLQAERESEA